MKVKTKQSGMTTMELLAVLVIIGIVGGVIGAKFLGQAEEAKRKAAKIETARFARTLGTLLANGVTLLSGLSIVKETLGNRAMGDALDGVIAKLREGKGFGRPLLDTGLYPPLATQMILVG